MTGILVGTSSWTDATLIKSGAFYPPGVSTAEKRLAFYASNFPLVEVDSSYYYLPTQRNSALWVARTPADFIFNIKAYSLLTHHPTKPDSLPAHVKETVEPEVLAKNNVYVKDLPEEAIDAVWDEFREALLPLDSAGKLGAVLFQFPKWFVAGSRNRDYILSCKERLPGIPIAVEFRRREWMDEEHRDQTLGFLADNGLAYVNVDEPQGFDSSVPPTAEATSELAMVRFHGRNREAWEAKGLSAAERFRYLYEQTELAEWAGKIKKMAQQAGQTHVLMNNCYRNYAVTNAGQLMDLLGDAAAHSSAPPVRAI